MLVQASRSIRRQLSTVAAIVTLVLALAVVQGSVAFATTPEALTTAARARVFFGHQSVGLNILSGVPAVYADGGVSAPPIEQGETAAGPTGGFISHQFIGENGNPLLKIADFDRTIRAGMGRQVDVALMKFCYVDITAGTDVNAVFAKYRDTLAGLARDFPTVSFIRTTVPLTTNSGGQADNAARERLNTLIRGQDGGNLFDLAAIESTRPDGTRVSGQYGNQAYFALYDGYAPDSGHLNALGSKVTAAGLLEAIARASQR